MNEYREYRVPSDANDNNNGCNEFKQFRITKWRRPALVSIIFFFFFFSQETKPVTLAYS